MAGILTEQDTMFGSIAYRNKFISQNQLGEAVQAVQENPGLRLGDALVQKGFLSKEQVEAIVAMQGEQRKILEQRTPPPPRPAPPVETAPAPPPPAPADSEAVFDGSGSLAEALAELEEAETKPEPPVQAAAPPEPKPAPSVPAPETFETLHDYLVYARASHASDVHLSAGVAPFLRRFGRIETIDVPPLEAPETEKLIFDVLSQTQKAELIERRSLECCLDVEGHGRYRACLMKQRCGWDGVFHVVGSEAPSFERLGLPKSLMRLTEYTQGMALVTGPGNSGKTTTLAALVDVINRSRDDHVVTLENPVEYVHESKRCQITQREVGLHTRSFSVALRAALREDPDIIMVGELRDLETLSMAITASETGHLVLGTLHTTSAANTVSRIVDGFPVSQQQQIRMMLSESLRGVVSQQLVPRADRLGVALALEILFITPAVAALIRDDEPHQIPSVMQTSRKIGMRRMDDSLVELAEAGVIEGEEASRRAVNKAQFERFRIE